MTARLRFRSWFTPSDPDRVTLARGVKAAVVVPAGLAVGLMIGQPTVGTFAAFGGIALLLLTDLPGDRAARLGSYLLLTLVGAVLITAGTLLSTTGWAAVVGMLVVGFLVLFSGVVSAAVDGGGRAALLTFILPVCLAAPVTEIPARLAGWLLAAALAVPAAVLWWPPRDHAALRIAAAEACRRLGQQILRAVGGPTTTGGRPEPSNPGSSAAVHRLRDQSRQAQSRPVALTTGSRLLGSLVDRLSWLHTVLESFPSGAGSDRPAWVRDLGTDCAHVMLAAADALAGGRSADGPGARAALDRAIVRLEQDRVAAAASRELLTIAARTTEHDPAVLHELTYTTLLAGGTVAAAARADARSTWDRILGRHNPPATLTRLEAAAHLARGHLDVRSVWFQNSLRGGLGLALAVLLAEVTEVAHGFWVVLGAMSVLRTTAVNTGATALRALGGTFLGFLLGAALMVAFGGHPVVLWVLLPIAVGVAACVPTMMSFIAGQTAFTVLVVVLFNIVSPVGWSIGVVRIEDVGIGAASAVVCALLWPRGAAGELRRTLADAYRTAADALTAAVDAVAGPAPDRPGAATPRAGGVAPVRWTAEQTAAAGAAARLDDAVRQYLSDHGSRPLPPTQVTAAADAATRLRLTAGAVLSGADQPGVRPLPGVLRPLWDVLHDGAEGQRRWFAEWTAGLTVADFPSAGVPTVPSAHAEREVLSAVRRHPTALDDPDLSRPLCGLWWTALFLDDVTRLQERLVARTGEG